jgi:oligopeptide/dipeptide ABC transporter ATP-binding protein
MKNILEIRNLKKHFPIHGGILYKKQATVFAVDGINLEVREGETLGLVGESGCGKSTLGKTILNLYEATSGEVIFNGVDILKLSNEEMRIQRRDMQIIFQDPYESLNSRHTIGHIIEEPLIIHNIGDKESRKEEVKRLLKRVGLPESAMERYPHEFSGGQRQRIGIARAISLKPKLILCDEPVSALDVSIQSQVLNLLLELQKEMGLSYVFIAHDLAVVKHISDRIAVMYLGKIVEIANSEDIYSNSLHPYTKALISAIPEPDPTLNKDQQILEGEVPSPRNPPSGCSFRTRCPYATEKCSLEEPQLISHEKSSDQSHLAACHYINDIK